VATFLRSQPLLSQSLLIVHSLKNVESDRIARQNYAQDTL
jgi:hypothetical protein